MAANGADVGFYDAERDFHVLLLPLSELSHRKLRTLPLRCHAESVRKIYKSIVTVAGCE